AKRCLLMSSFSLSKIEPNKPLDPLAAIGVFLCYQKLSIVHLSKNIKIVIRFCVIYNALFCVSCLDRPFNADD
ncbi:hypothetical protein EDC94DRAFT_524440, partial [Helicostylum pulchrum]